MTLICYVQAYLMQRCECGASDVTHNMGWRLSGSSPLLAHRPAVTNGVYEGTTPGLEVAWPEVDRVLGSAKCTTLY